MKIEALSDQICQFAVKMENLRNMANLLNNMIYSESDEIDFLPLPWTARRSLCWRITAVSTPKHP